MAKQQAQPRVVLLTGNQSRGINPNKYTGPFRAVWCAEHHFTGPWPCDCPAGPQTLAWNCDSDEIGLGGTRGSSKTHLMLAWMAFRGNPKRLNKLLEEGKQPEGADVMYINHRNFRGLLLRAQANDLEDLIDRAEEMWVPTGAVIKRGNPSMAEWRTGAKIIFGHFGDNGWKKYVGPEYQRIAIDQAEMMESKEIHDRIIGSCRSKWSALKPQVMLTFNPGGGDELAGAPGQAWLMDYFCIEAYERGDVLKRGDYVIDEHGKHRTFIMSKWSENPYLCHYVEHDAEGNVTVYKPNEGPYVKWLNSIEPLSLRDAWRDGNWHALSGAYFRDFRPNGPLLGEEKYNANHVYDPAKVKLEPWFHRWMAIDWGYIHPSEIGWFCKSPWGQTYLEKEIGLNRVEPFELGILIARESKAALAGVESHQMVIYLSPDAYAKRESENTVASQIAAGINSELGPHAAFVADLTDEEREMDSRDALESLKRRRREQSNTMLTLVRASTDRVAGWMHIQTMLRFRPLQESAVPDQEFAEQLELEKGIVARLEYESLPEFVAAREILPKLLISKQCRNVIKVLPMMMHKPGTNDCMKMDATETKIGDDAADLLRYGCFSEEKQGAAQAPLEVRVEQQVAQMQARYGGGMSHHSVLMVTERARYREQHPLPKKQEFFYGHNRLAAVRAMRSANLGRANERIQ